MSRVQSAAAARILGISPRSVLRLAARGELPGSARIGKLLTFDEAKLRAYVNAKELEQCQRITYTSAGRYGGCEPPSTAGSIAKAYDAAMSRLLGRRETRG